MAFCSPREEPVLKYGERHAAFESTEDSGWIQTSEFHELWRALTTSIPMVGPGGLGEGENEILNKDHCLEGFYHKRRQKCGSS